jgi:demethylmenaquinone methyltransferase/2-methoxy-6-polyprenyl-1,4-benzoquinol methylase
VRSITSTCARRFLRSAGYSGDRAGFVYLNDSIRQFPSQPQLASELRGAGFSAIAWKDLTGGIVALHTAIK